MSISKNIAAKKSAQAALAGIYAGAEGRGLTGAEVAEERSLVESIERNTRLIESEARNAEARSAVAASPLAGSSVQAASFVGDKFANFVDELRSTGRASLELRDDVALMKSVATDGAELVQDELASTIVTLLEEGSPVIPAVRTISTAGGQGLLLPRMTSESTPAVVAEGATIPRSGPQFDQVSLGANKIAMLLQASRELLEDSPADVVRALLEQSSRAIARSIESEILLGTNFTEGIFDSANANNVTVAGTAGVTADELLDIFHALKVPYRAGASWIISDATAKAVRQLKDSTGQYLWQPGLAVGQPPSLLGSPVIVCADAADMATGNKFAAFGNLSEAYTLRRVGSFDVTASEDYALAEDLMTWRFVARADGALVNEDAVVIASNA